ncbi:MAG: lipoyl(octanoyl) transferase LipB [Candidatus Kryptoniota bacterium]
MNKGIIIDIGFTEYLHAWEMQKFFHAERTAGTIPDVVLFTEHHHTYTIGKSGGEDHLLASDEELKARGVSVFKVDRGGDITYHGPGQLVAYPIFDLSRDKADVHRYIRGLEDVVIRTLQSFGIIGRRDLDYTGVWVGDEKICAIGIKVSRWVTMHGFAFNVNTDLSYFERIIPCGIFHKGVTSLSKVLRKEVDMNQVKSLVAAAFQDVFQSEFVTYELSNFMEHFHINMEKEHASC